MRRLVAGVLVSTALLTPGCGYGPIRGWFGDAVSWQRALRFGLALPDVDARTAREAVATGDPRLAALAVLARPDDRRLHRRAGRSVDHCAVRWALRAVERDVEAPASCPLAVEIATDPAVPESVRAPRRTR